MASVASACNSKDFLAFMDHFTLRQQAAIKRRMEDVFTVHEPEMTIDDVVLLAEGDEKIVFGVRYGWGTKSGTRQTMASRVIAKKVDGRWRVDSEQVKSHAPGNTSQSGRNVQPVRFDLGGGGAVNATWDAFNPPAHLIDPALEHLRGDIGIQPGRGCVGGRCGLR
jgi:ketosteroid isomerase-like protein